MVRLKGTSPSAKCASCTISIPHGTIKSQGGPAQVHAHDHISIPHGQFHMVRLKDSIKANGNQEITFQFHMVRLKVYCWELLIPASCIISIPHGSIKRSRSPAIPPRFQRISIPHGTIKRRQARERILRQHRISIPHGTIKSLPSCS